MGTATFELIQMPSFTTTVIGLFLKMRREALRVFSVGILVCWVLGVGATEVIGLPSCHFPAIYNFGDSNSDTGRMSTAFYQLVWPFGESFFHEAAGRSSDRRLMVDFIEFNFVSIKFNFVESLLIPYILFNFEAVHSGWL